MAEIGKCTGSSSGARWRQLEEIVVFMNSARARVGAYLKIRALLRTAEYTHCLKITQNIALELFEVWHFPPSPIKNDLSGNTV